MKLLVSALEPSSNLHLSYLLKELVGVELIGIYDESLAPNPLYTPKDFSVMGFVDVLKKISFFKKTINEMCDLSESADRVLLMDSSGFNIPLAQKIKKKFPQKEIIYYILPQAWAWKKYRAKKIDALCDKLCAILPFEVELYTKARYVGHPLLDEIKEFKTELIKSDTIAFLPGSRRGEIAKLMPIFKSVRDELKDKNALLVVPPFFDDAKISELYGDVSGFEVVRDTHGALLKSEFAFICSGTATLESALIGTPLLLAYKAKAIDFFIAKRFVNLKYSGLANLMLDFCGKPQMHPEFFQDDVNAENLLKSYYEFDRSRFLDDSKYLREYLSKGSAKEVAKLLY